MNSNMEQQIMRVITEAKQLLSTHEFQEVLLNDPKNKESEVWDAYAKQINYTNKFLAKKKDLLFIVSILTEARNGLSENTPSNQKIINKINSYVETIKALLKGYQTVEDGQYWILSYYQKGGGQIQ